MSSLFSCFLQTLKYKAYNSVYNYDILVLGETYLSGDISHDETFIEGFSKNPFRKDDPILVGCVKAGFACILRKTCQ